MQYVPTYLTRSKNSYTRSTCTTRHGVAPRTVVAPAAFRSAWPARAPHPAAWRRRGRWSVARTWPGPPNAREDPEAGHGD